MGAKVLKMDGGAAKQAEDKDVQYRRASYYADDRTARYLLVGKDERGKAVYFIRVGVTGLRRRVFGPYRSKGRVVGGRGFRLMSKIGQHAISLNRLEQLLAQAKQKR